MSSFEDFLDEHVKIIPVGMPEGPRPIWRIAQDIDAEWVDGKGKPNVNFAAVPYLEAMRDLGKASEVFGPGHESAKTIVAYFINNAGQWKGERACEIKNELRRIIGQKEIPFKPKKGAS